MGKPDDSTDSLARRLIDDASGDWQFEAATRLVCEHGYWLNVPEFFEFIRHSEAHGRTWIGIDWKKLVAALRSDVWNHADTEVNILRIAASLTPYGDSVYLWKVLENQSLEAIVAISRAELHVTGYEADDVAAVVGPEAP